MHESQGEKEEAPRGPKEEGCRAMEELKSEISRPRSTLAPCRVQQHSFARPVLMTWAVLDVKVKHEWRPSCAPARVA